MCFVKLFYGGRQILVTLETLVSSFTQTSIGGGGGGGVGSLLVAAYGVDRI
jgi:hypothetical protein